MNKVFLVGRVSQQPEQRTTNSGISVTTFTVAVNRRFNREQTDFIRVVTWRVLADNCARYLVKGQQVSVIGELHIESYDDANGQRRYRTEVVADDVEFLARPGAAASGGTSYSGTSARSAVPSAPSEEDLFASEMGGVLMDEEELPF